MAYLFELILFLTPFLAYGLWRRLNPNTEPSTILLVLSGCGIVLMVAGGFWYGLSRSMPRDAAYVPAHLEGERIEPGHSERRR
jgi:hypothetical protein